MLSHLEFEDWVPFPLEKVFAFFSNPENLPRLMPASTDTKLIHLHLVPPLSKNTVAPDNSAGTGSVIDTSFRMFPHLPFRARWTARIVEFEPNHHFIDVQDKGPFRSWKHRHEFEAVTRDGVPGTVVRDKIEYEVGFGLLGTIADRAFVRRQMIATFEERQKKLPKLLAGSV